jgi:hypothetical protein
MLSACGWASLRWILHFGSRQSPELGFLLYSKADGALLSFFLPDTEIEIVVKFLLLPG